MNRIIEFKKYPLTKREAEVLGFIHEYFEEHGYTPLAREIAEEVGFSVSRARHVSEKLAAKGHIKYIYGAHRGIRVLKKS